MDFQFDESNNSDFASSEQYLSDAREALNDIKQADTLRAADAAKYNAVEDTKVDGKPKMPFKHVVKTRAIYGYDTGCGSDLLIKWNCVLNIYADGTSELSTPEGKVEVHRVKRPDFVNGTLPAECAGAIIVAEDAHFIKQTEKSVAQIFTYEQLVQIKKVLAEQGIDIKLIAHHKTATSRNRYHFAIQEAIQGEEFEEYTKEPNQRKNTSKTSNGDNNPELVRRVLKSDTKNSIRDIMAIMLNCQVSSTRFNALKAFNPCAPDSYDERERLRLIAARQQLSLEANMARPNYIWHEHAAIAFAYTYANEILALLTEEERAALGGIGRYAKDCKSGKKGELKRSAKGVLDYKLKVVNQGNEVDAETKAKRMEPDSTMFALLSVFITTKGSRRKRQVEIDRLKSMPADERQCIEAAIQGYNDKESNPEKQEGFKIKLDLMGVQRECFEANGEETVVWTKGVDPNWLYVKNTYYALTAFHQKGGVVAAVIKQARQRLSDFQIQKFENPNDKDDPRNGYKIVFLEDEPKIQKARAKFDKHLQAVHRKLRAFVDSKTNEDGLVLPSDHSFWSYQ